VPACVGSPSRLEQHVDEVKAWLDRYDESRLEPACQAQVGMTIGSGNFCTRRISRQSGNIVHLQAQQVANAVRKENCR
jgi:hypothetical protein